MAHAFVAAPHGDPGPRNRGFMSLREPRRYFSTYGTLMFLWFRAGWPEDPPVNEYRLTTAWKKVGYALAGPVANLAVGAAFGLVTRLLLLRGGRVFPIGFVADPLTLATTLCYAIAFANLAAWAFNMLPIPGLDGWRVVEAIFLPLNRRWFYEVAMRRIQIVQIAVVVLFIAGFIGIGILGWVMSPFYEPVSILIYGGCASYPFLTPCLPLAGF
jgi:Zn-dependent protease